MNKLIVACVLSALVLASFVPDATAGRKGGDIIIIGGQGMGGGGGMPAIFSSGGKKSGSMIFMGRRKRSVEAVQAEADQQPQYTVYRLVEAQQ